MKVGLQSEDAKQARADYPAEFLSRLRERLNAGLEDGEGYYANDGEVDFERWFGDLRCQAAEDVIGNHPAVFDKELGGVE